MKRFAQRYEFSFDLAPERLWRAISDTDAVNRDAGLPPVTYTYEPRAGETAKAVAHAAYGPLRFAWDEPPFTWEAPRRVAIERLFHGGPFARFSSNLQVEPDGSGARVVHAVELDARGPLGSLLAPFVLARGRTGAARAYAAAAARARSEPDVAPTRYVVDEAPPVAAERVAPFSAALAVLMPQTDHEPMIAARLASLVTHGDDATVARMRPYVLADAWQLPRERVLAAMLAATRGGLLDLSWTIVCPSCRGQKNAVRTLAALQGAVHCASCGVAYGPDFDRNVEVTFDACPSGRTAVPPVYCTAGPQTARQTLAQTALAAGGAATLDVVLPPGAYVVQAMPDRAVRFVAQGGAGDSVLSARIEDQRIALTPPVVRAGQVRIELTGAATRDAMVRITEAELSDQIATAAEVTALQAFRDLFSSEVLAEGVEVAIRSLTLVFTDIIGSTQLYAQSGDARAFRLVREHFDALHAAITLQRGAIVKTIGDAVMAVFVDPGDAAAAALAFSDAVAPLRLRIGIHRGPCIALRANERLDYFGGTVNVASRIAHAAGPDEIVLSAAVADDPRAAAILPPGERGTLALRGVEAPVDVLRIVHPAGRSADQRQLPAKCPGSA